MGLGPPVCEKCRRIMTLDGGTVWKCPKCGGAADDKTRSLWQLPRADQQQITDDAATLKKLKEFAMSRSGYTDDGEDGLALGRWRAQVRSAIRGKRGQAFLKELIDALDAMDVKALIAEELVATDGAVCAIGAVCKARGLDVRGVDYDSPEDVAATVGIASQMVAEIEYENDEGAWKETDEQRWDRMRRWAESNIVA